MSGPGSGDVCVADPRISDELEELRRQIEWLDAWLVMRIAERVRLARRAGEFKRAALLPTLSPGREAEVIRRAAELARAEGIAEEDVREIFWHLIGLSRRAQAVTT